MRDINCVECGFNIDFLGLEPRWCEGCDKYACEKCLFSHHMNCNKVIQLLQN